MVKESKDLFKSWKGNRQHCSGGAGFRGKNNVRVKGLWLLPPLFQRDSGARQYGAEECMKALKGHYMKL